MNKLISGFFLLLLLLATNSTFGQKKQYNNLIILRFNPDSSICKVGDDDYLATSSFEYFPGVPIYHSTDLVNWQIIGHALHRPEQLDLDSIPSIARFYQYSMQTNQKNNTDFEDNFNEKKLNLACTMIQTPQTTWWDLETRPGNIPIQLRPDQIEQYGQPSFLGICTPDMKMKATTTLNFDPKQSNEFAGLAFKKAHDAEWTLVKEQLNYKLIVSVYQNGKALLGQVPLLTNNTISLKIELVDFKMTFSVKENDASWQTVAETKTKVLLGSLKQDVLQDLLSSSITLLEGKNLITMPLLKVLT